MFDSEDADRVVECAAVGASLVAVLSPCVEAVPDLAVVPEEEEEDGECNEDWEDNDGGEFASR